jgi:hypothetical protein
MEILDRVLDRGIVVDPSARVRLAGTELRSLNDRLIVDWPHSQL